MPSAYNYDPGLPQATIEPAERSWQLDGQSRDLSGATTAELREIPESMMSRLSILFGAGIAPQDALEILKKQRSEFERDENGVHNFDLFAAGHALDDIYHMGKGDVAASVQGFYRHFANLTVESRLQALEPEAPMVEVETPSLEIVSAKESEPLLVANELGKRAARFTVNIYGKEVEQLRITEEDADLVASMTVDTYTRNIKVLPDDKRNEYQQFITLMLGGLTDQQIALETGVRPARVSGFFNQFKSRLVTSGFDQAFALTTLQRKIVEHRNPGLNVDNILAPSTPTPSKRASEVVDLEPSVSRYYTDSDLADLHRTPFIVLKPEEKIAMPADYLAVDNSDEYPDDWQERGLCAQTDPEIFYPEKGGSTREAKKICQGCEIREKCLEYAMQNDERYGIWGGLSERERRKLKKDREAAAAS